VRHSATVADRRKGDESGEDEVDYDRGPYQYAAGRPSGSNFRKQQPNQRIIDQHRKIRSIAPHFDARPTGDRQRDKSNSGDIADDNGSALYVAAEQQLGHHGWRHQQKQPRCRFDPA
jgi:hypothetical protein